MGRVAFNNPIPRRKSTDIFIPFGFFLISFTMVLFYFMFLVLYAKKNLLVSISSLSYLTVRVAAVVHP